MPKLVSIDDQRYAALTLQSLRVTIGPLQASTTSLESQESYLTAGMLPYNWNVTLQTFLSSTRDFYRLHSTFARLYNAAASPASRLRSAGSLAIIVFHGMGELRVGPRSGEHESRNEEKEKPLVTLDLNLTFMQTPGSGSDPRDRIG